MNRPTHIALLGEYSPDFEPHRQTIAAIQHSAARLNLSVTADWISTADFSDALFKQYQAIWVAPGSPYKDMLKTILAIKHAREHGVPCFGTCGGFQHMVIEYSRHVLELHDAQHAEYDPYASRLIISRLACSLAGREMQLTFAAGSKLAQIYDAATATERYYCNFGLTPDAAPRFRDEKFHIVAHDAEGEARVMEISDHPFFIGTLYVPQARSTAEHPHPLVTAFLQAAQKDWITTTNMRLFTVYRGAPIDVDQDRARLVEDENRTIQLCKEYNQPYEEKVIKETIEDVGIVNGVIRDWFNTNEPWIKFKCPKCGRNHFAPWKENLKNPLLRLSLCECIGKWLVHWKLDESG